MATQTNCELACQFACPVPLTPDLLLVIQALCKSGAPNWAAVAAFLALLFEKQSAQHERLTQDSKDAYVKLAALAAKARIDGGTLEGLAGRLDGGAFRDSLWEEIVIAARAHALTKEELFELFDRVASGLLTHVADLTHHIAEIRGAHGSGPAHPRAANDLT